MGLLGSTALIAASLAVSPAFAQVVAGGGTITHTNGTASSNAPGASDGVSIVGANANQSTINSVSILNTTGVPTADAVRLTVTSGVALTGVNSLRTNVSGGSGLYVQSNANLGVDLSTNSNTFQGSYGVRALAAGGFINFNSTGQTQTITGNGTALIGIDIQALLHPEVFFGTSVVSGFATGVQLTQSQTTGGFVSFTSTGGSINATGTGIRADAVNGAANVTSQTAITALTGINATGGSISITTSGGGTINAANAGVGAGISASSSAGAINVSVGAAIGNVTRSATGVSATMTSGATGAINITTTAAIAATNRGLEIAGLSGVTTGTINIGADISAATAVYANIGSYNVTVASGVNINSTASTTAGLYLVNGVMTATNNGTIVSTGAGFGAAGVRFSNDGSTLTNNATGSITGHNGVYLQNGPTTVVNAGVITGTGGTGTAGIHMGGGGSLTNTNAITGYDGVESSFGGTFANSGSITGVAHGLNINGGAVALTNTGTIDTVGGSGGAGLSAILINSSYNFGTSTITNSATITGGGDTTHGYGVEVLDGAVSIVNQSGGTIRGGIGAVLVSSNDAASVTLQTGSSVIGNLVLSGTGARTLNVAGGFLGNLDATGNSGNVNLTLNTSATGYVLLHAGSGTDSLTFDGSGSRSFSVDNLSGWETGSFTGGAWTLTGTGNQNSFTSGVTVNGAALTVSNTQQFQGATGITLTGNGSITTTASLSNTRTINLTGPGSLGVASGQTFTQSGVISGAGALTLNGPGTLVLSGTNTYSGGTVVNSGILRLNNISAAGTGVIRMLDPQINFAATGTYANAISLEVANGQQAADPTILNNMSGGSITLAGRIYETGGVGGAGQYVTLTGGSITLSNDTNSWGGVTTINSGATVLGTTGSISGGSIVNDGTLTYQNVSAGTANQAISGSGAININGTGATLAGAITTTGQLTISGAGSNLILAGARSGSVGTGAYFSATGGSLGVANGGSIVGGGQLGVHMTGVSSTLNNLGSITNSGASNAIGAAVYVEATSGTITINNGSVTDTGAGSTIRGWNAGIRHDLSAGGLLVVNNYGLVQGDNWNGIENSTGGLTVNNFAGGFITTGGNGNGISSASSSAVSITNAGVIGRNIAGDVVVSGYGVNTMGVLTLVNQTGGGIYGQLGGVWTSPAGASVTNGGTIAGAQGVYLTNGGTVANQAGGVILATNGYGVRSPLGGLTVTNAGVIRSVGGPGATGTAISTSDVSSITNNAGGVIAGQHYGLALGGGTNTVVNSGVIAGIEDGIYGSGFAHSITNSGVIVAGATTDAATTLAGTDRSSAPAAATGVTLASGGTVTNLAGGAIAGRSAGVLLGSGGTVVNAGLIDGSSNDGVRANGALTLNNQAGGVITGVLNGAYAGTLGGSNSGTIQNSSTGGDGALVFTGGSFTNTASGQITGATHGVHSLGGALTFINAGTITGGSTTAFTSQGALSLTNSGTISATTGAGVTLVAGGSVTNSGILTGGNNATVGYGIYNASNSAATTITNQSGGVINGGTGAIHLAANGAATIDLQSGSTTTGQVLSTGSGLHTVNIAGVLNGAFDASSGTGVDNLTLAATGSMTSANLGSGADSFTYQGGAFSGVINAGSGVDSFTSALGAGSASVNLTNLVDFETFAHQSGTLTLTGTRGFSGGASVTGGTLVVNGTLQTFASVASGATLSGGGTITGAVTVADGGALANTQGSTLTMGSLTLSSGSLINATFSGTGGNALFAVDGALTLDGSVNVASTGAFGFGVYGLMTYTGALNDQGLLIGTAPGAAQRMSVQTSVAGQVNIVHAPNELLFWDGGNGAQHDNGAVNGGAGVWTAAGSEWTDASGLSNGAMQPQPGFAIFQGSGGTVTVDNSLGAVGVTGMQFAANGYRIEGDAITLADAATVIRVGNGTAPGAGWTATIASALTDAGGLVKTDLGTLILAGDSDYTGGTTVNSGTVQIGDGATAGSIAGSVVLANGSTLVFSRSDNHDFANAVSGTGTVNVNGIVTLSGAITATNGVGVSAGSTATLSSVSIVNGNAVFGGLNSIVSLTTGGTIQSQNGTGVFLMGANGAVNNAGTITAGTNGVFSNGGLTLTNEATGTINAVVAVTAIQNLDLTNDGVIAATNTAFNSSGIYAGGTGAISNTGTITSGSNVIYTQGAGTLTNSGLIQGGGGASTVRLFGANSSVSNLAGGEITTTGTGAGLYLDGLGATVINSGTISGGNAVNFVSGGGSLTNDGVLSGTTASGVVGNGGTTLANLSGGSITGVTNGVNIVTGSANLTNDGAITGTSGHGVLLQAGGTIINTGDITGGQSGVRSLAALNLTSAGAISGSVNAVESVGFFNDSLTFLAGSTTDGAVLMNGGDDFISLAGALNGVLSAGDGADTVSLFDTASFSSILDGGDGVDAFVLDGSGNGSLAIDSVVNFESRTMNGTGVWTLTGVDVSAADWNLLSGTLAVTGGSAINDAANVIIGGGGALALLDDETIAALSGSGFVDLGFSVLTLGGAQSSLYSGVISGFGDLVIGAGYGLTLTGANTYTGTTVVDGVLTLGASNVLADTSSLLVRSGGAVDLQTFNEDADNVFVEGILKGSGTLTAFEYGLDGATVNANLGSGALYNLGGVSTLNGMIGADLVLVDAGTLVLGASDRLADSAIVGVAVGATLDLGVFNESVDLAILQGTLAGTGTLTGAFYGLADATVNANLGTGVVFNIDGISTLNGTSSANLVVVDGGTLRLGASDRIVDTADLQILSGATFDLGAFEETVNLTAIEGTLSGAGTLTAFEHQLDGATIDANLAGASVYVVGGASTLNGVSSADLLSVLGGSLTLGASDRIADAAILGVSSGATLDIGAFDETVAVAALAGTLAGTGTLTAGEYDLDGAIVNANLGAGDLFNTGGVSTLNGTSGSANVWVQAGTLAFGASNRLADTATVSVASGSTLNLGAFNDTVNLAALNGTLAGTGTLTAAQYQLTTATVNANLGVGTLFNLGGVSTLNGTSAASAVFINAGTLRLGANERLSDAASVSVASGATFNLNGFNERVGALFGMGDVNVGAGRLTFGGVESGFGGRLSGTGSVLHTGGLFTLLGDHSIASISNTGGELRFAGTTTGGISASGGSVTGAGTIGGALTASNGAVLSPGLAGVQNGIGGFTAGGLTLNGGTLAIDVLGHSAGNLVDQLRINGAATLTGGILAPTFHGTTVSDFATRYLFLQANNLVGTFANGAAFTAAAQEGLFWRVRYDLAPNAAVLELRQLTNLDPGASGTGNQRAIGQALSGGQLGASDDWAAVIGLIAGLTATERSAALDSISGEPLADVTTSMFSANDTFLTAVRDGGMGGRNDGGEALNFVGSLSFSGGRDNSADRLGDVLGAFDPSASTERGSGGWVSAYAGDQTLDGKPGQATVESRLNGFAGGYGVRHGSISLGAAAGVTRVEGDVVARDGHYESDLSHAAAYVAFDDGVWAADVSASFYGGDLDTRRGIAVGAFRGTAIGNTHTEGQALSASVARRFQVSDNTMIALGATGTASNASVDGYTETGAGALSLQASGQERDWQSLQLSARGTQDYRVNGRGFRIYGGAGVMAMAGDRQATGDMRFTGAPVGFGTFVVEGAEAPPLAGLVDFGLEVGAREGVTVSAGYRGLFSERLQDNQIGVKLNVSW